MILNPIGLRMRGLIGGEGGAPGFFGGGIILTVSSSGELLPPSRCPLAFFLLVFFKTSIAHGGHSLFWPVFFLSSRLCAGKYNFFSQNWGNLAGGPWGLGVYSKNFF